MPDGAASRGWAVSGTSCEHAHSAGTDEQPDDDEHDPEHKLSPNQGDDAGDDEDDGKNPQQRGQEASQTFRDRTVAISIHISTSLGDCAPPKG